MFRRMRGDPPNAIYIRPLTRPLDRPAGNWSAQMGNGNVDHFAFSIENFQLEPVRAELARRGLDPKPDGEYAWTIKDPSGAYAANLRDARRVSRGRRRRPRKSRTEQKI